MPQVASAPLIVHAFTATGFTSPFTVPSGYTVLLKAAIFESGASATASVGVRILHTNGVAVWAYINQTLAAGADSYWSGWHALGPGDQIEAYSNQTGVDVWISGAVLNGVSPVAPVG